MTTPIRQFNAPQLDPNLVQKNPNIAHSLDQLFDQYMQMKRAEKSDAIAADGRANAEKDRQGTNLLQYGFDPRAVTPEVLARSQPGMQTPEQAENPLFAAVRSFIEKKKSADSMATQGQQAGLDKDKSQANLYQAQADMFSGMKTQDGPQTVNIGGKEYIITPTRSGPQYKPVESPEAVKAIDREAGKEYADFIAAGGYADVKKNLSQLSEAAKDLEGPQGAGLTGAFVGKIPDSMRSFTQKGQESISTREKVEEVVQRNLRIVLGAQFTEKEGERLIARSYNPQLPPAENAKRVRRLINQIDEAAKAKEAAGLYLQQNGTLRGFTGKIYRSVDDFNVDGGAAPQGQGGGIALTGDKAARLAELRAKAGR